MAAIASGAKRARSGLDLGQAAPVLAENDRFIQESAVSM